MSNKILNLKKWLSKNGYAFESKKMIGGYEGVFISLEIIQNNSVVGIVDIDRIFRYLKKTGLKNQFRGYYTSLLVWE